MQATAALGKGADAVRAAYGSQATYEHKIASDFPFTEPALALASRQSAGTPTWLYRFGYVVEEKRATLAGAPHASDVPFQFDKFAATGARSRPLTWRRPSWSWTIWLISPGPAIPTERACSAGCRSSRSSRGVWFSDVENESKPGRAEP